MADKADGDGGAIIRTARCCCAGLQLTAKGDPSLVIACHCVECQRRTGSVLGVGAYFRRNRIAVSGASKVYVREGGEGRMLRVHFCPECGSSLYWEADILPGFIAVAVGAFADPDFPVPQYSVWEQSRHGWLNFAHRLTQLPQQAPARERHSL